MINTIDVQKAYDYLVANVKGPQDAAELILRLHVQLYLLTCKEVSVDKYLKIYCEAFEACEELPHEIF